MKTLKAWEKSGMYLEDYLGDIPVRIDEDMFLYIMEVVPPQYMDGVLGQTGDPSFTKDEYPFMTYYITVTQREDKYYYLGVLPEFK